MNTKLQNIATAVAKVLSVITGLAAYSDLIPQKFLPVAALVFALSSSLKEVIKVLRDYADDGKINKSVID